MQQKQKDKFYPYGTPYTITSSKWIIDLNIKPKTTTLLEENIGEKISVTLGSAKIS